MEYVGKKQMMEALSDGKAIRRDSWVLGRYVAIVDGVLVDEDGCELPKDFLSEHMFNASDVVIMRSGIPISELTDVVLWGITRELVFSKYIQKLGQLNYRMAKFARDHNCLSSGRDVQYVVAYNKKLGEYIPMSEGENHPIVLVGFLDRQVCYKFIEMYKRDLEELEEYRSLVCRMQQNDIGDLSNTTLNRYDLEMLYKHCGGKDYK